MFPFKIFYLSFIQFLSAFPLLFFSKNQRKVPILLFFSLIFTDNIFLNLFRGKHLFNLEWNWFGKILEFFIPFLFILIFNNFSKKEKITLDQIGYKRPICLKKSIFLTLTCTLIVVLIDYLFQNEKNSRNLETFLFQMTMPGLSEEPLYRGLYPLIITLILGKKTPLRYIIPIILFTAAHVIYFDPGAHAIRYSFAPIIPVTIFAIVATYLKEKCQSIYPSILMHNVVNTFIFI